MIGMVFISLSDLMYGFGQTDLAARFGEDALRYTYLTDASESVSS